MKFERSDATVAGVEGPCGRAFAPSFLLSGLDPSLKLDLFFKRRASAACYAPCPSGQWEGDVQYPFLATSAPRKTISAALLGLCQSAAPTVQPIPHVEVAASRNLGAAGVKPEDLIL